MRWLVVLLCALLIAGAWLLAEIDAPPPAPPPANAPPAPPALPAPAGPSPDDGAHRTAPAPSAVGEQAPLPPPPAGKAAAEPGAVFVVVDEAGQPLEGAVVQAIAGERGLAHVRTDAQGVATLGGVPPDAGHRVRAFGHWPVVGEGCVAGTTTRVVLRAEPMLSGRVFDGAGSPVAGAEVRLLLPLVEGLGTPLGDPTVERCATNAEGSFRGAWPDAVTYDLRVTARGYAPAVVPAIRYETHGSAPVVVHLQAGATLRGVLRDAAGAPLIDVRVEVSTVRDEPRSGAGVLGPSSRSRIGQPLASTTSMARGEFTLADLPAVPVVVTLDADLVAAVAYTTLVAGQTTEVELRAEQNASLRGEVPGAAEGSVAVFLYGGPNVRETQVRGGGGFEFRAVPPGRYLVGTAKRVAEHVHAVQDFAAHGSSALATTIDLAPGEERTIVLAPPSPRTQR